MAKPFVMYVMTDTHYVPRSLWEEGEPVTGREEGDQIALKSTPEILRTFFNIAAKDAECSAVLITGDLINNGAFEAHTEFKKELKILTDSGKRVFVTCATHDYTGDGEDENIFHANRYTKTGSEPVERTSKYQLTDIYRDFGPSAASSLHRESGSYSVGLCEGLRLIAICDNGNGRSHCGLFEDGFEWLRNEIRLAKKNGERVMCAVHHPVIPPWEVYRAVADFECFGGYEEMKKLLCEEGCSVIFTGHTHVQGIRKYTDAEGRFFYDVTTSALPGASGGMRRVKVDTETGECDISTVRSEYIEGFDTKGLTMYDYIYRLNFFGRVDNRLPLLQTNPARFIEETKHVLPGDKLKKYERLLPLAGKALNGVTAAHIARLTGVWSKLTPCEKKNAKRIPLKVIIFTLTASVFPGNCPYTPDTVEYKVLTSLVDRVDIIAKLAKIDVKAKLGGDSLREVAEPFIYNNRTGDDDNLNFTLL